VEKSPPFVDQFPAKTMSSAKLFVCLQFTPGCQGTQGTQGTALTVSVVHLKIQVDKAQSHRPLI
jgi:hypothetical protein